MKKLSVLAIILTLVFSLTLLAGCDKTTKLLEPATDLADGGVIVLTVNPKIAIEYDDSGKVTGIIARNDDALKIVSSCEGLIGLETKEVITRLVDAIGEAGYFVEDIDGNTRGITLEIESGSYLPNATFLDDIIAEVKAFVAAHDWKNPVEILGETPYGMTDYHHDSHTDYDHHGETDYCASDCTDPDHYHGITDYGVTDYGKQPAVTEPAAPAQTSTEQTPTYGNTDYGITDYNDTDYGVNDDGVTDYDSHTDYGKTDCHHDNHTDYGRSDYNDSDYGRQ